MTMNSLLRQCSAMAALVFGASSVHAQPPHVLGMWQLDIEASSVPDFITLQPETRGYFQREDGYIVALVVRYGANGADFIQVAAKSDGQDYPEYRSRTLADFAIDGTPTPFTYSETIVDEYAASVIAKFNGQVTTRGTRTVAEDGQTMLLDVTITQGDQEIELSLAFDRLNQ